MNEVIISISALIITTSHHFCHLIESKSPVIPARALSSIYIVDSTPRTSSNLIITIIIVQCRVLTFRTAGLNFIQRAVKLTYYMSTYGSKMLKNRAVKSIE